MPPEIADVNTGETIASQWGNDIRSRTVQRYASAAARTTEHPSPVEGDLSYLQDTNAVEVWDGSAWREVPYLLDLAGSFEIDNSTEVASVAIPGSFADVASVTLSIPASWGSWKCEAWASYVVSLSTGFNSYRTQIRIDGLDQQQLVVVSPNAGDHNGAVGGRITGQGGTGNKTVSLQATGGADADSISDIYLYARAVRQS